MGNTIDEKIAAVIADINRQNSHGPNEVGSFVWGTYPDGRVYLGKIQPDVKVRTTSVSKNKEEFFSLIDY